MLLGVSGNKSAYQGQFPLPKGDTEGDTQGTPKKGQSLSQCIVRELESEPDYDFTILDVCDRTGIPNGTVKRTLNRLSSPGKGSGKVRKVGRGLYRYYPEKGGDSLQDLARSGEWKLENLCFTTSVPLGAHPTPVSPSEPIPEQAKGTPSDPCIPVSLPGYPWHLPAGQLVTWDKYENGTQMIRLSANGAPPFSPDHVLTLIDIFRKHGLDPEKWECTSQEINKDGQNIRIDASYSLPVMEGIWIKVYQHGYNARIEVANRRTVSMREVMDFIHGISGGINLQETRKEMKAIGDRVQQAERTAHLAYSIAAKVRDKPNDIKQDNPPTSPAKGQYAGFTTASQLQRLP